MHHCRSPFRPRRPARAGVGVPRARRWWRALLVALLGGAVLAGALPASAAVERPAGVDVSRWQHPDGAVIDWAAVRASGRRFTFIRATKGPSTVDTWFRSTWDDAVAAGVYRGAYHYAVPSAAPGSAEESARFFVSVAGRHQGVGDLPPVLDLETTGGLAPADLAVWTRTWLQTVERLTGRRPVVYTYPSFWHTAMADNPGFGAYPLWIAHWGATSPRVPAGWTDWTFWQHSETGSSPGIVGPVDLDVFNGSLAQLAAVAHPASTLRTTVRSTSRYAGEGEVLATGAVLDPAGRVLTGERVVLRRRIGTAGPWTAVASTRTTETGYRLTAPLAADAFWKVTFAGGITHAASESSVRAIPALPVRRPTTLTLTPSRYRAPIASRVALTGRLALPSGGAVAGARVVVQQRVTGSGAWRTAAATVTSRSGAYRVVVRPRVSTSYRVVFTGTTRARPSRSRVIEVTVR